MSNLIRSKFTFVTLMAMPTKFIGHLFSVLGIIDLKACWIYDMVSCKCTIRHRFM